MKINKLLLLSIFMSFSVISSENLIASSNADPIALLQSGKTALKAGNYGKANG